MPQAYEGVSLQTELSIINKSNEKLLNVTWFLFINKIRENKLFRIFKLDSL